jgi:hypothetical protein
MHNDGITERAPYRGEITDYLLVAESMHNDGITERAPYRGEITDYLLYDVSPAGW